MTDASELLEAVDRLDALVHARTRARHGGPLIGRVRIDRRDAAEAIAALRAAVPAEVGEARRILDERRRIVGEVPSVRSRGLVDPIDELERAVDAGRRIPLTNQILVDLDAVYAALDELRGTIPQELKHARGIVDARDEILREARRESGR